MLPLTGYPATAKVVSAVLAEWPEHETYITKGLADRDPALMAVTEQLATAISLMAPSPEQYGVLIRDYRYLCEVITLPEEFHFRRHGCYRLSTFAEAEAEVYSNGPFMARYLNGLLVSNVIWSNHARAFGYFSNQYLPMLKPNSRHLEIGPGHGLYLYFAARSANVAQITGWDVSQESIDQTRSALTLLGCGLTPELHLHNVFDPAPSGMKFDSVTMSEILEHVEDPVAALRAAYKVMNDNALLFVNVPANSPSPDHIFLVESVEHAAQLVSSAGFKVEAQMPYPMTGATLERAVRHKLAVSCVVIGRKA